MAAAVRSTFLPGNPELGLVDTLSLRERSERMSRVRSRDTKPEQIVRRHVHAAGLRYRLHRKILSARPDLVFPGRRIAVMVHGCMWHQHPDPACRLARMPKSRLEFWRPKLEGNRDRDERQRADLEAAGWTVITVWECQLKEPATLSALIDRIRSIPSQRHHR